MASITSYHKFNGLKQQKFTLILEVRSLKSSWTVFLLEAREENVSFPFSTSRAYLHSLVHDLFLTWLQLLASITSSSTPLSLLPPVNKDPCDYFRPTWIIQDHLFISFAKPLFCCKVIGSGDWDINIFRKWEVAIIQSATVSKHKLWNTK